MLAGFARIDITPPSGVELAGYGPYYGRRARAVLAPLHARALALQEGPRRALILSVEVLGFESAWADLLRRHLARATGIPPEAVWLVATHTHSGPAVGGLVGWGEPDPAYRLALPDRLAAVARAATAALQPVTWYLGAAPCEGIAVNREIDGGQGFAADFDFDRQLDPAWRPAHSEWTDPVCRVLVARAGRRTIGLLHHFACHPVVGGEATHFIHGDFPGLASLAWENRHRDAVALFLPGALGDINPSISHVDEPRTRRALRALGARYRASIGDSIRAASPLPGTPLRTCRQVARFRRESRERTAVQEEITHLDRCLTRFGREGPRRDLEPETGLTRAQLRVRLAGLRLLLRTWRRPTPPNPAVNLQGLRIGPLRLLGCGLEIFHAVGQAITAGTTEPTWVVSLVGGLGYAPDAAARGRRGRMGAYTRDFVPLLQGQLPFAAIDRDLPQTLRRLARELD
jgi:hypothetical protein